MKLNKFKNEVKYEFREEVIIKGKFRKYCVSIEIISESVILLFFSHI